MLIIITNQEDFPLATSSLLTIPADQSPIRRTHPSQADFAKQMMSIGFMPVPPPVVPEVPLLERRWLAWLPLGDARRIY